ncbi:speckle-type POZ protein A-like [Trichogramma pretiosum]|uniref:speckle-type POZ protein A-like n=1 Tax=Trichogramma pretiosum TaxID=7493 RepID=UPI000C718E66|nr:speckle-type POZ protein A-like [Trichogramma pretiosum]
MSSANKFTGYTYFDREYCDFTWVISDYSTLCEDGMQLISPEFHVGKDGQNQFTLELNEIQKMVQNKHVNFTRLDLYCEKSIDLLPLKYKLTVIKDDMIVHSLENSTSLNTTFSCTIFEVPFEDMNEFISSNGSVIFRCELSVFVGEQKNLLNYESVDANEVPKLKFGGVLLDKKFSDVMLRAACGKEIPAHRLMLAAASPVFNAMFSHDMLEKESQTVNMVDINFEAVVEMLRYIYTGNIENDEIAIITDLLVAADKYQLGELKNRCEKTLSSKLSSANAVDILKVADKHGAKYLEKKAVDFVKLHVCASSDSDVKNIIFGRETSFTK